MIVYADEHMDRLCFCYLLPKELLTHDINTAVDYSGTLLLYINFNQDRKNILRILQIRHNRNYKTKILLDGECWETGLPEYESFDEELRDLILSKYDFLLVVNDVCNRELTIPRYCKTFTVDLHGIFAYNKCIITGENFINNVPVKYRKDGANLLVGKVKTRLSRFVALYQFYKHNLLDTSVLGINATPNDIQNMMQEHPEYSDENFYNKIITCLGPADSTNLFDTNEGISAFDGYPFSPTIYSKSSVSYICETFDYDKHINPYLMNEKFYRSIVNKHPFIVQGSPGQLETIRSFGYKTFDQLIDESYNKDLRYDRSHVELAVLALKDLTSKIPHNTELVQNIVDHNFNNFCELMDKEYNNIIKTIIEFAYD